MSTFESVTLRETATAIGEMLLRCFGLPVAQEMGPFRVDAFDLLYAWYNPDNGWRVRAIQDLPRQRIVIEVMTQKRTATFERVMAQESTR